MELEPLSSADRIEVSSAIIGLATASKRLANAAIGHQPETPSVAATLLEDRFNSVRTWRGSAPIRHAHEDVFFAELAAFDHMRAYVAAIDSPEVLSVSLATIARGGIEAFGRAKWMVEPVSAAELVERHAALTISDLRYIIKLQAEKSLRRWGGKPISARELEADVRSDLLSLGLDERQAPTPTGFASELLEEVLENNGRLQYSQISSIAHGESFAVNAFLDVHDADKSSPTSDSVSFGIPRSIAIEYALYLATCCAYVQRLIIDIFNVRADEANLWDTARTDSLARIAALAASRVPPAGDRLP
ncbi:hypothetical protein ACPPVQ_13685 [Diaminobutyricibacter sp. McL0618]|uniref:hypothetical protein n=1 Tax=Leifsonia sp. McL0618 TaxID=3415677 RepID=UPI003CF5A170